MRPERARGEADIEQAGDRLEAPPAEQPQDILPHPGEHRAAAVRQRFGESGLAIHAASAAPDDRDRRNISAIRSA